VLQNGYACCPQGTQCVAASGSGYGVVYNCTANNEYVVTGASVCKPGPPLPYSTSLKNVLIIGDSLSIGYTPYVAQMLADVALVQHAPWDVSDGGAEETAYGELCLKYFLHSPSGLDIAPDVIWFNWGMHDGVMSNSTVPGQNGNSSVYAPQLANIVQQLVAFAKPLGTKLIFGLTTAYMCSEVSDGAVITNNNAAAAIMTAAGIPFVASTCVPCPRNIKLL
jgi:hypothetical protein